jgi:hypothetical protein
MSGRPGIQYSSAEQQEEQTRERQCNQTLRKITFHFTIQSLNDKAKLMQLQAWNEPLNVPSDQSNKTGNMHITLTFWYIHIMFIPPRLALHPIQLHFNFNLSAPTTSS